MARGRMINQSIAEDVEFNEMSIEAQLMFMRTLPFLDRDGLISGSMAVLKGKVAPLLNLSLSMNTILQEWLDAGLVMVYQDGKKPIMFFIGFAKNQIGMRYEREPESAYPAPPGYIRTPKGMITAEEHEIQQPSGTDTPAKEDDGEQHPASIRQDDGNVPADSRLNRIEGNRIEGEGNARAVAETSDLPEAPSAPLPSPKPEKIKARVAHFDPRQTQNGLLPKGTGKTQIEIWKESFSWVPTAAQIRDMNEKATDLGKWRQVTADCAIKAFRSYTNVMDVYLNGWRDSAEVIPKQTVTGNLGISMASI